MAKKVDYSIWLEENSDVLNLILNDIFKSINHTSIPKNFNIMIHYDEKLKEDLLAYIYANSSSAIRMS